MEKIKTLNEIKDLISPIDWNEVSFNDVRNSSPHIHFGGLYCGPVDKDSEGYKILEYMMTNVLPPLKLFKWGDIETERKQNKFTKFHGIPVGAQAYQKFLPHGSTCLKMTKNHAGFGFITDESTDDDIRKYIDNIRDVDKVSDLCLENLSGSYYHAAKAHWLTQSIQEEGLWAPIQGLTTNNGDKTQLQIHPGSVRSGVFEEMEDPNMELLIWDTNGSLERLNTLSVDDVLEYWNKKLTLKDVHKNISLTYINGVIEWGTHLSELGFREKVFEFNKKVHKLSKGKPLNIYIGYDSTMNDLESVCKFSILKSIKDSLGQGQFINYFTFEPEIKLLDISKLPDYNREYANQSTEFTYSRFLIPYLENYEGFSIFIDNDFIFKQSILPMFNYLNPNDAVACIKYPHYEHAATKFDGEVNIDYPCKLWSSLMIFNNGHEDCKKLTPEVVNTWTGKQLHQFEWTDKISPIPQKYIFVEGYDNPEEKWNYTGIHYTRGGPWIKDMDSTTINNLDVYEKYKILFTNQ